MLSLLEQLSPYARVATAVAPFVAALLLRIVLGKNRLTGLLISFGTMWFAINVLMAPYSPRMTQDLQDLQSIFR